MAVEKKELKGSEAFFALVYHLRLVQKQYVACLKELHITEKNVPEGHVDLENLKQQMDKLKSRSLALEKIIDERIKYAEDWYTKNNLTKFWL